MKRYILYGITLLMACPLSLSAQDEILEEQTEADVRKIAPKKKQYETRVVKGSVLDATTGSPIAGAIVSADGINGYSVLTDDKGNYELKAPVFASALRISTPDYNAVVIGLSGDTDQKVAKLYPSAFDSEYVDNLNLRNDKSATDFQYSNAVNIKDEIQKQLGAYARTVNYNGTPGVGSVMFMQGLNSLNVNAQPLVVIDQQYSRTLLHDGLYNDILSNININDIEKVTVLRNGTALYGAKGANGVIQIQTRRSQSMATHHCHCLCWYNTSAKVP